jgi:blue copper oxidase
VVMDTLRLGPGERAEVIIDFSNNAVGDVITLQSRTNVTLNIMDFNVVKKATDTTTIPSSLTTITKIAESTAVKTRTFVLGGMGADSNINGLQMNMKTGMDTIHETVNLGDTEIWKVTSAASGGMPHPFHAHGVHFQVLDINGQPPPANLQGWKDTVLVDTANTVRLIGTFKYTGVFMLHCHNLEHEDAGMMLQYQSK